MTNRTRKIGIYILLMTAGLFILFKFYLAQDCRSWLAIAGFMLSPFCLINIVMEITNLFYPSTRGLKWPDLTDRKKFENFKGKAVTQRNGFGLFSFHY